MKLNAEKIKLVAVTAAITLIAGNATTLVNSLVPSAEAKLSRIKLHKVLDKLNGALDTLQGAGNGKNAPSGADYDKAVSDIKVAIADVERLGP